MSLHYFQNTNISHVVYVSLHLWLTVYFLSVYECINGESKLHTQINSFHLHPLLCIKDCFLCSATQRTQSISGHNYMGSQSSRWDKSCLIIWSKVRTKERFHLVRVLRRGVKKRPQRGRRGFIWLNYWKMIRCDLAVPRQLECPHPSHTLLSTYRQLFISVFQVAMPTL